MSYTKGPWKIETSKHSSNFQIFDSSEESRWICDVDFEASNPKENANLISCAPEMLEALEEAKEFIERFMSSERDEKLQLKLDLLIKKAKGE